MSSASKGSARERQVRKLLEEDGYVCVRSAASKGCVDVWALKNGYETRAVQVKGNQGSPWKDFGPKARWDLSRLAKKAGAWAELWHWPPRGECRILREDSWPDGPG